MLQRLRKRKPTYAFNDAMLKIIFKPYAIYFSSLGIKLKVAVKLKTKKGLFI